MLRTSRTETVMRRAALSHAQLTYDTRACADTIGRAVLAFFEAQRRLEYR